MDGKVKLEACSQNQSLSSRKLRSSSKPQNSQSEHDDFDTNEKMLSPVKPQCSATLAEKKKSKNAPTAQVLTKLETPQAKKKVQKTDHMSPMETTKSLPKNS